MKGVIPNYFRGRPLIIWGGGVVKNTQKNLNLPQKKKFIQEGFREKKLFKGSPKKREKCLVNLALKNFF